jgi:hypothetical protein
MLPHKPWGLDAAIMRAPLIQEIFQDFLAERLQWILVKSLEIRFGPVPDDVMAELRPICDPSKFEDMLLMLHRCDSLEKFRKCIGHRLGAAFCS